MPNGHIMRPSEWDDVFKGMSELVMSQCLPSWEMPLQQRPVTSQHCMEQSRRSSAADGYLEPEQDEKNKD